MEKVIKNFNRQFEFEPIIENIALWEKFDKFLVVGMGGSHLSADLIKAWQPELDLITHMDYGLPRLSEQALKERLIIISSYSGNTEEALDAYQTAREREFSVAVISVGGQLLDWARNDQIPYIQMPDTNIQPRSALGYSFKSLLKLMGQEKELREAAQLAIQLKPMEVEKIGLALADKLEGYVPIIYSSLKNYPVALNWRVKFNETSKIPAFSNFFPELNHNEMTGFDRQGKTKNLSDKFYFIILQDEADSLRVKKRMEVLKKMYQDRGLKVETALMAGPSALEKIFSSIILADWTAYYLARKYQVEPEQVPMVEEFKKMI